MPHSCKFQSNATPGCLQTTALKNDTFSCPHAQLSPPRKESRAMCSWQQFPLLQIFSDCCPDNDRDERDLEPSPALVSSFFAAPGIGAAVDYDWKPDDDLDTMCRQCRGHHVIWKQFPPDIVYGVTASHDENSRNAREIDGISQTIIVQKIATDSFQAWSTCRYY